LKIDRAYTLKQNRNPEPRKKGRRAVVYFPDRLDTQPNIPCSKMLPNSNAKQVLGEYL